MREVKIHYKTRRHMLSSNDFLIPVKSLKKKILIWFTLEYFILSCLYFSKWVTSDIAVRQLVKRGARILIRPRKSVGRMQIRVRPTKRKKYKTSDTIKKEKVRRMRCTIKEYAAAYKIDHCLAIDCKLLYKDEYQSSLHTSIMFNHYHCIIAEN